MIIDARTLPQDYTVETDVCIVGAGVAGISLARECVAQEFRVCLLESGGQEPDPETQALYRGESVGQPYYELDNARTRCLGGSSVRWHVEIGQDRCGARLRPLDGIDFEEREWVPFSGWPFHRQHMEPFYERAQTIYEMGPATYQPEDWEIPGQTASIPFHNGEVQTIIFKFGARDLFKSNFTDEVIRADNISTYLWANVLEIETDEPARTVTRLRVGCLQGNKFWVSARLFVLAAGGIETPRLLFLSNKVQNAGLGNQNDLVGRYFMEHHHFRSAVYVPSRPNMFTSTNLYNDIHTVRNVPIIGKLALADEVLRRERLLNSCVQLIPHWGTKAFLRSVRDSKRNTGFALRAYRKIMKSLEKIFQIKPVAVYLFANMSEQLPNPNSRVKLSTEKDSFGQNRLQLNWRISAEDIRTTFRTHEIISEEFHRAGLGQVYIGIEKEVPPKGLHGGYHHMGTTRMHVNPKMGVVDQNSQIHGISNLFIAGPSVFPTGGYANPVLTIIALSLRLADHLKHVMK